MMQPPEVLKFARFELHLAESRLLADGLPVSLGSRALLLLKALAQRPGELLTKEELLDLAWPDTVVLENNLPAQISALRKVLGRELITTVAGRGYRFSMPIENAGEAGVSQEPSAKVVGAAPVHRTNLPHRLAPMLGRESDLAELQRLLSSKPLVTVIGPGGIGKSHLVGCLLESLVNHYPHGVCWVELAAVEHGAALAAVVASALGLQMEGTLTLEVLARALAPLHMLIALDNAEHLLAGVAELADAVYHTAPNISLIVTSQAPLRLKTEQVHRLGRLAVPDGPVSAQEARQFAAVALFEQCASRGGQRFELSDGNAADCAALCRALDGLPLAIELAAARLPVLGLQGLMRSLHEKLQVLTVNADRLAPMRQQTLRATLGWSHSLLAERERQVFRRLGVVIGTADLPHIQKLMADEPADNRWAVIDAIQVLVERSLLTLVDQADAPPRYRMLQTTRAYALERLAEANELEVTRRCHASAMGEKFACAWPRRWDGSEGVSDWHSRLSPDLDNASEALAWAHSHGEMELVARIGVTLLYALDASQYTERLAVAESCLDVVDAGLPPDLQLQVWLALSFIWIDSHWPRSDAATRKAVDLAREQHAAGGDPFWLYLALGRRAVNAARTHALALARETLQEMHRLQNPGWPAQRLLTGAAAEGVVAFVRGDYHTAMTCTRLRLALTRAAGEDVNNVLCNLVDVEIAAGEAQIAVETGVMLVERLRGTRNTLRQCMANVNLMAAWLALGRTEQARALATPTFELALKFDIGMVCCDHLALLMVLEGRYADAMRVVGCSDQYYEERGLQRLGNEAASVARVLALAQAVIGAPASEAWRTEGRHLNRQAIGGMALDAADTAHRRKAVA